MAKKTKATKKTKKMKTRPKTLNKKTSKKATKKASKKAASGAKKASKKTSGIQALQLGEILPEVSLPATGGRDFQLSNFKGKALVLYFYPKDATSGCTLEGQDFTRLHGDFKSLNAEVFGISRDSLKSHENFKAKENYTIDLLSDADEKLCSLFNVIKEKNMYGKKVLGIERSTFVLDGSGKVVKEWRGVKVPGHAEEVLSFVKTMPVYS